MNNLWSVYHQDMPDFLISFIKAKAMQRLKHIGMNCGCEYTSFPFYHQIAGYSRYDHSIGVALIIWHFTEDMAQTIAGLLHDIATPVFAHVIDFLNNDHLNQESTEHLTEAVIIESKELMTLLQKYNIKLEDVKDYHVYSIADNNTPQLSADRLEYTLGNLLNYNFSTIDEIKTFYHDICVGYNEYGLKELLFQTPEVLKQFSCSMLKTSKSYVSDEDRFSMQLLAEILRYALSERVLTITDLYADEPYVIKKLCADSLCAKKWEQFTATCQIKRSIIHPEKGIWFKVDAKKRYIDGLCSCGERASKLFPDFNCSLEKFLHTDFSYWVGVPE